MIERFLRQVEFRARFFVAFEEFYRVPALLVFGQVMYRRFFDVRDGVFHNARIGVMRNGFSCFRRGDSSFRRFHDAFVFQRGNFHHFAAELTGKFVDVDFIARLSHDVHHVDGDDDGQARFHKLRGKIQVSFEVRAVDDV